MLEHLAEPTVKFCEANIHHVIAQPANSWSNIVFFIVGFYILYKCRNYNNSLLKYLGYLALLVGTTSFIYHATFTFFGQILDLAALYILLSYFIILNLYRLDRNFFNKKKLVIILTLLAGASTAITLLIRPEINFSIGVPVFLTLVLGVIISERFVYKSKTTDYKLRYLLLTLLSSGIGFILTLLDLLGIWCDPATFHFINGHMVWHLLNGVSFLTIYLFYRQFDLR